MPEALIVVPDATRKAHLKKIVPMALERVRREGFKDSEITVIVATGLHKPHAAAELKTLVGEKIFSRYRVISHAQGARTVVMRGRTKSGVPIVLNRELFRARYIVTIGLVEPHLYAGYSGGAKTIAIGLAGEATINATHHPNFLDRSGTALCSVRGNPFQDCLWEIIKGLPVRYTFAVVNDARGRLRRIFEGGDLRRSFDDGVACARGLSEKKADRQFDAVLCRVPPPKDATLYQASRAFNYVLNTKRPIVKKGGIVLVSASLRQGYGKGIGEKRFAAALRQMRSADSLVRRVKKEGCRAGEHRAYMVAKALTKAALGFIGPRARSCSRGLPLYAFRTEREARAFIRTAYGSRAGICTIANALATVVSVRG